MWPYCKELLVLNMSDGHFLIFFIFIKSDCPLPLPTITSLFLSFHFSQRVGEEGSVTMHYLPGGLFASCNIIPQVVIRVSATDMVEDQQQEEVGPKQCEGLWFYIFLLFLFQHSLLP